MSCRLSNGHVTDDKGAVRHCDFHLNVPDISTPLTQLLTHSLRCIRNMRITTITWYMLVYSRNKKCTVMWTNRGIIPTCEHYLNMVHKRLGIAIPYNAYHSPVMNITRSKEAKLSLW